MIYTTLHGIDTSEEGRFVITFNLEGKVLSQIQVGGKDIAKGRTFKIFKQTPQSAIEESEPHADDECIQ